MKVFLEEMIPPYLFTKISVLATAAFAHACAYAHAWDYGAGGTKPAPPSNF